MVGYRPLVERQNTWIDNGLSVVLKRGPVLTWLVTRRRGAPAPEESSRMLIFTLVSNGFEAKSNSDVVGNPQAPAPL